MSSVLRRLVATSAVVAAIAAGCGGDDDDDAATQDTTAPSTSVSDTASDAAAAGDVLEVAAGEGDLNTFLSALEAAGVMEGLHGEGPFTVFIPTDDAFGAYLDEAGMNQAQLFAEAEMLRGILDYHVVNMAEDSEMVMAMAGQSFTTAAGTPLAVTVDGDTVMVGNATVERYDIPASNGVIHVIDGVLIPPEA